MDLVPGIVQGITRVVISYPFDYIKVHLQKDRYKNLADFCRNNRNLLGLYRGISIPLTFIPLERGIQYKYYEVMNKRWNPYVSGLVCGLFSNLYSLPIQFINNNYVINQTERHLLPYIRALYTEHGLRSFYRGYRVEIPRSSLSTCIYLGTYGNLRDYYGNNFSGCVISSSIAGVSTWSILFPLDTLRTEIQTNNKNPKEVLLDRIKSRGIGTLWKGILPVYLRTIPSSSLGMIAYEYTRKMIQSSSASS